MATIKDVARVAGVAPSTISKYINGGNVRSENAEAIRKAIAQLDYHADPFARGLKSQRNRSVGVLLPELAMITTIRITATRTSARIMISMPIDFLFLESSMFCILPFFQQSPPSRHDGGHFCFSGNVGNTIPMLPAEKSLFRTTRSTLLYINDIFICVKFH